MADALEHELQASADQTLEELFEGLEDPDACVRALQRAITEIRECERQGVKIDGIVFALTGLNAKTGERMVAPGASTAVNLAQAVELHNQAIEAHLETMEEFEAATEGCESPSANPSEGPRIH